MSRFLEIFFDQNSGSSVNADGSPVEQPKWKKFLVSIVLAVLGIGTFIYSHPKNLGVRRKRKMFKYVSIALVALAGFTFWKKNKK